MEKYREIEKSIIKKFRKPIWSKFVKAVKEYELIQENDKIAVCISGGKDSFLLAKCLEELQRHGIFKFNLVEMIFGDMTVLARIIYILVGVSGLWGIKIAVEED